LNRDRFQWRLIESRNFNDERQVTSNCHHHFLKSDRSPVRELHFDGTKSDVELLPTGLRTIIMKHGGLTDGAGQLKMAGDKLEEAWEAAHADWNDIVRRTMDEEQMKPLFDQLRSTLDAVSRVSVILGNACRECEDERQS
jgi:hypothetical protein